LTFTATSPTGSGQTYTGPVLIEASDTLSSTTNNGAVDFTSTVN